MKRFFALFLPLTVCLIVYQNCGDKSFSGRTDTTNGSLSNDPVDGGDDGGGSSGDGSSSGGSATAGTTTGGSSTGGSTSGGSISGGSTSGGSTSGGSMSGGSTSAATTTGGSTSSGVDDDDVVQVKTDCDNARSLNRLRTLNQKIVFDDTKIESGRAQVCQFGIDGNLSMVNTRMQARYEQYRNLNLPTGAVVCDLNMTTPLQRFKYDDVFVFTFNGRILATNNRTALYQTTPEQTLNIRNAGPVSIYRYDWLSLRTRLFENVADDYCLGSTQGAATCQWPVTEQNGNIQFDFDQQLLIALGLFYASNQQQFGFIITGDNDPSLDCYHERLEFDMNVQYYIK